MLLLARAREDGGEAARLDSAAACGVLLDVAALGGDEGT